MKTADTVLLVSHEVTAGIWIIDSLGHHLSPPRLVIEGRPNDSIVKERQVITGTKLDTLIQILSRPFAGRQIVEAQCFMPHHAVFIIKNGRASYIDICFHCMRFEASADLHGLYAFDPRKWQHLYDYFVRLGFKYELEE